MHTLRERLRVASRDNRITFAEAQSFIRAAMADGDVNEMEEFFLSAALDAYRDQFEPDALQALQEFLKAARDSR